MLKLITFVSLVATGTIAAAAPAPAVEAADPFRFEANGSTFSGTRTESDGVTVLRGAEQGGKSFLLRVKGDRVTGTFGAHPVNFAVPARREATVTALR